MTERSHMLIDIATVVSELYPDATRLLRAGK